MRSLCVRDPRSSLCGHPTPQRLAADLQGVHAAPRQHLGALQQSGSTKPECSIALHAQATKRHAPHLVVRPACYSTCAWQIKEPPADCFRCEARMHGRTAPCLQLERVGEAIHDGCYLGCQQLEAWLHHLRMCGQVLTHSDGFADQALSRECWVEGWHQGFEHPWCMSTQSVHEP
jgi:hypothetical protein